MASIVQICNWSLGHIGINKKISSLNEPSAEAIACNNFYTMSRDALLSMNDWEWCKGIVSLQLVSDFTMPGNKWLYAYAYPPNTLKLRGILNETQRLPAEDQKIPYELYDDDDKQRTLILTDQPNAMVEVTRLKTNTEQYPTLVAVALSWMLAGHIANPLRVDAPTSQKTEKGFANALREAIAVDTAQRQPDIKQPSEFERARR